MNTMKSIFQYNFLLLLVLFVANFAECNPILKDNLRVVSSVRTRSKGLYKEWYLDEYLDKKNLISSMRLYDLKEQNEFIYYNDYAQRKMLLYDPQSNTCRASKINELPFSTLRQVAILMTDSNKLTDENTELGMGASSILFMIINSPGEFKFKSIRVDKNTLTAVNNLQAVFRCNDDLTYGGRLKWAVVVNINIQYFNVTKPKNATNLDRYNLGETDIVSVVVCKIDLYLYLNWNHRGPFECPEEDLVAEIEFHYTSEAMGGTLIGQDLDKSREFDFEREPFMQPVGIGCWDPEQGCLGLKEFAPSSLQFSAEYITTNGSQEISFVAYDGYRRVLRLDRRGRKSVYDLETHISYHLAKFTGDKDKTDLEDRAHNCIAMESDPKVMRKKDMLENLLGVSREKKACHLGTKMVDHINYHVYERELTVADHGDWRLDYRVPILLEAVQFTMPKEPSPGKRYFITYYVQEYADPTDSSAFEKQPGEGLTIVPKFMELWEYNVKAGVNFDKKLLNRLEFLEFSWALDVDPIDDPNSRDPSLLFNIESCSYERSQQLQMRYRVGPTLRYLNEGKMMIKSFERDPHLIREILHEKLSSKMDIPPLNIVQFDLYKQPDWSLLVDARVVDMTSGLTKANLVGFAKYLEVIQTLEGELSFMGANYHSIDDCRLESLASARKNALMFCEGLTLCGLFNEDKFAAASLNLRDVENQKLTRSDNPEEAECRLELFSWARLVESPKDSVVKGVFANSHRLIAQDVRFDFRYREENSSNSKVVTFNGHTYATDVKMLDPRGVAAGKSSPLVGIRYTTTLEESKYLNLNQAFRLRNFEEDKFKFCHLACQLDEYCGSFSFCSRKNNHQIESFDCILSTMRLTGERIGEIDDLIRNKKIAQSTLRVTSYSDSQEYKFKQSDECSIHPKDFVSSYQMKRLIHINNQLNVSTQKPALNGEELEQAPQVVGTITTLEECAEDDYESTLWTNLASSNFTYCPIGSNCILYEEHLGKLAEEQICYQYEKSHLQYYEQLAFTHMSILLDGMSILNSNRSPVPPVYQNEAVQGLREELEKAANTKLATSIEGLKMDECARDCNLMQSKCLSFDFCTLSNITVCNLYSLRSPVTRNPKQLLGYLPIEKQFFDKETKTDNKRNVILIGSSKCQHFYLKDNYFNIRLQQLLELSQANSPSSPSKKETLEEELIKKDQKKSDEILEEALRKQKAKIDSLIQIQLISSGFGAVNLVLILIGAVVGSIVLLYGGQTIVYVSDQIQAFRSRRNERFRNHRISQLALYNNHEI